MLGRFVKSVQHLNALDFSSHVGDQHANNLLNHCGIAKPRVFGTTGKPAPHIMDMGSCN